MSNVPKLRFREFSGEWEEKKLTEVIDFKSGYAFSSSTMSNTVEPYQLIKMSNIYQNVLSLDRSPSYWKNITEAQKDFLLEKGDIVLTLTGTVGKRDYGYSAVIPKNDKYLLNQRLVRLRAITHTSLSAFIHNLVLTERFLYHFFSNSKGGTGNQSNVSIEDLKNIRLPFPSKQEQEKIASFLTSVDTKIEQLAKKEKLLGQYKKGVMQKIFNQEIRFKADDGSEFPEWEEKKLSSLCNIQKGSQLNKDTLTETGNHPAINGGINPSGYTSEYNTEANTITISEGGNSCGYVNFITTKFWSGGHNYSLQDLKTNIENKYLFQYLKHNENSIMRLRVGSGLPNIQKNEINNFKISVPCLEEQTKIANFLSSIDTKTRQVQNQLKQTKAFKKALLQQMFV